MDNLSKKALLLKEVFHQLAPGTIRDLIDMPGAYRVLLQDGRTLLARLTADGTLAAG